MLTHVVVTSVTTLQSITFASAFLCCRRYGGPDIGAVPLSRKLAALLFGAVPGSKVFLAHRRRNVAERSRRDGEQDTVFKWYLTDWESVIVLKPMRIFFLESNNTPWTKCRFKKNRIVIYWA